jgi:hypothetical protein
MERSHDTKTGGVCITGPLHQEGKAYHGYPWCCACGAVVGHMVVQVAVVVVLLCVVVGVPAHGDVVVVDDHGDVAGAI